MQHLRERGNLICVPFSYNFASNFQITQIYYSGSFLGFKANVSTRECNLISSATSLSLLARTKLSSHQLMIVIGRPVPVLVTFCVQIYVEQLSSGTRTSIELCIYGTACLVILNLLLPYTSLKLNYMNITLIN